ncbi:MAG: division/cell wall cluster transcriptional repressor MraZ [Ignavibacteria bacterium]|nr:division/cell wall cluster transcriptional repressor MraZ [Ignavibacteria bacterium]
MFKGTYLHNIDVKGRLSIPAKLRKYITPEADNSLVMLPGVNKCIEVYPKDIWDKREEGLLKLNINNPDALRLIRLLSNRAHEDTMDPQYRVLIPQNLLKYASISTEILIVGTLTRIEFWNPAQYDEYLNSSMESLESLTERFLSGV